MDEEKLLGLNSEEEEVKTDPKAKAKSDKESESDLDSDVLKQMMMTGENEEGMFTPDESELLDEDEEAHADTEEDADIVTGKVEKRLGKYADKFLKDMKDNPDEYIISTPEGEMSIFEALKKGYDPATKEFTAEPLQDSANRKLDEAGLNEQDRAGVEAMLDPSNNQLAPADAAGMGLDPNDPMVQGQPQQQMDPSMMQQDPNLGGQGGVM